jgi:hypothetical protein
MSRDARMRTVLAIAGMLLAGVFAGCASSLGTSNFTINPTEVGWKTGEEAVFVLHFNPENANPNVYTVDPVFAISEVKFEQDGIHLWGDYDTKRAQNDLGLAVLSNGSPVQNFTLTSSSPAAELRVQVPTSLGDGQYRLDVDLFQVGWVKSDLFRVAT